MNRQYVPIYILALGLTLGGMRPAAAQLPLPGVGQLVHDPINFVENAVTAAQVLILVTNSFIDLTGLDALVLGDGSFAEQLATMQAILQQSQALHFNLQIIQRDALALFDPRHPADNAKLYWEIRWDQRRVMFESYNNALLIQSLLSTVVVTIHQIQGLYENISRLIGTTQGGQLSGQWLAKLTQLQTQHTAQTAAFQQGEAWQAMATPWEESSVWKIQQEQMVDMPATAPLSGR